MIPMMMAIFDGNDKYDEVEYLGALMTGVKYEKLSPPNVDGDGDGVPDTADYASAGVDANGDNTDGNPEWEKLYNALANNYNRNNGHMKLIVTKNSPTSDTYTINIYLDQSTTASYRCTNVSLSLSTLVLQSHWGSGVIFSEMDVTAP